MRAEPAAAEPVAWGFRFCYFALGECNFLVVNFQGVSPHFRAADLMLTSSPYTALQPVLG